MSAIALVIGIFVLILAFRILEGLLKLFVIIIIISIIAGGFVVTRNTPPEPSATTSL